MTIIEEAAGQALALPPEVAPEPDVQPGIARVLLVWDAPNLDMGLGAILGGRGCGGLRSSWGTGSCHLADLFDRRERQFHRGRVGRLIERESRLPQGL